ncbi:hypothetical protein MUK42_17057 [Musa troglodytarum]|uniref:Uncharacterized protein n=1 Tax=Musa troglodytarum TaxID=320322 RepID=A0A9E7I184_9LILI|nr:hypothetical protein MUK42_17057 [Musa troglodytarum]URE43815.1 hypothetical protein MUK42_17057 [Musa troglodytarum]
METCDPQNLPRQTEAAIGRASKMVAGEDGGAPHGTASASLRSLSPTPTACSFLRCPFFSCLLSKDPMTEIADPAARDLRIDMGKLTSLQVLDRVDYFGILEGRLCFTVRIPEGIDSLGQSLLTFQRAILQQLDGAAEERGTRDA